MLKFNKVTEKKNKLEVLIEDDIIYVYCHLLIFKHLFSASKFIIIAQIVNNKLKKVAQ